MKKTKLLTAAVERLAMSADEQIQYLSDQGLAPQADELALEFEDGLSGVELHGEVGVLLTTLADLLRSFGGESNGYLWEVAALRSRPEWEAVRALAQEVLILLKAGG